MWRGNAGTRYQTKWMQEVAEGHRRKFRLRNKEGHRGGSSDIETRWPQEVCGEARAGGEHRYSNHMSAKILNPNDDVCKKLWRDEGEKPRYWNRMTAGSCSETQVWESFTYWNMMLARNCVGGHGGTTYETQWMQEVVEGRDYRYWNPMNAGSLGSLMRGTRGGSLDIETRWMPQVRHFHPSWHQVEPLHNWEFPQKVWQVEIEKMAE